MIVSTAVEPDVMTSAVGDWIEQLPSLADEATDRQRIARILELERLKAACVAAQAVETAAFAKSRAERLTAAGGAELVRMSTERQVALARQDSPAKGNRHVGLALALVDDMPGVLAALSAGETSEWRATLIVRETVCLTAEQRRQVDSELAGTLAARGDRATVAAAATIAQRLDPGLADRRSRRARVDRRVTLRPAPDGMSYLTAVLPLTDAVAVLGALHRTACSARADGDPRSRGQLMADEFVSRVVGAGSTTTSADVDGLPAGVGVDVQLILTDRTLFDGDGEPAIIPGHGPIPAPLARRLVLNADATTKVWVRRLYVDPVTGNLAGGDTRRRLFPKAMREFLIARDQTCRTPWCDAPIQHLDHIQPHARGGSTTLANGQGLCEACNQSKDLDGWASTAMPDGSVSVTTPTQDHYPSHPPPPPRSKPWADVMFFERWVLGQWLEIA